jgi:Protein of unknown function (DUF1501)
VQICEHLPLLAPRSRHWSLVRSLTHTNNGHDAATYLMLTGRSQLPSNFRSSQPTPPVAAQPFDPPLLFRLVIGVIVLAMFLSDPLYAHFASTWDILLQVGVDGCSLVMLIALRSLISLPHFSH